MTNVNICPYCKKKHNLRIACKQYKERLEEQTHMQDAKPLSIFSFQEYDPPESPDPPEVVHKYNGLWYYWDRTYSHRIGSYMSQVGAEKGYNDYINDLMSNQDNNVWELKISEEEFYFANAFDLFDALVTITIDPETVPDVVITKEGSKSYCWDEFFIAFSKEEI